MNKLAPRPAAHAVVEISSDSITNESMIEPRAKPMVRSMAISRFRPSTAAYMVLATAKIAPIAMMPIRTVVRKTISLVLVESSS